MEIIIIILLSIIFLIIDDLFYLKAYLPDRERNMYYNLPGGGIIAYFYLNYKYKKKLIIN